MFARYVKPCYTDNMNVTITMDDLLGKAARHAAVEANMSLSAWFAELAKKALGCAEDEIDEVAAKAISLMETVPKGKKWKFNRQELYE